MPRRVGSAHSSPVVVSTAQDLFLSAYHAGYPARTQSGRSSFQKVIFQSEKHTEATTVPKHAGCHTEVCSERLGGSEDIDFVQRRAAGGVESDQGRRTKEGCRERGILELVVREQLEFIHP